MATYHILNGDCLADQLSQTRINQNFIVFRECLIDGTVYADNMADFWKVRAEFFADVYKISTEEYEIKTVNEFEKIKNIPDNSEVCLWFENDLFCQTNMWFLISILATNVTLNIYRVFPIIDHNSDIWKGFGISNAQKLKQAFESKIRFTPIDIELGKDLWASYQIADITKLNELSKKQSNCYEYLEAVCQAAIDRFPLNNTLSRPDQVVKAIIDTISTEFQVVFSEFSEREGIYGFGDLQLKTIYDRQMHNQ